MKNKINIISKIEGSDAYSKIFRNFIDVFKRMNVEVSLLNDFNIDGNKKVLVNGYLSNILKTNENIIPLFSINTNQMPKIFVDRLKKLDKILVYNNFTKDVLLNSGIGQEKIYRIPICVDCNLFNRSQAISIPNRKSFSFLTVVDAAKGDDWLDTVTAYYNAFGGDDDVSLIVKAYYDDYGLYNQNKIIRDIDNLKKKYKKKTPSVIFIGNKLSDIRMAGLFKSCDCYIKIYNTNTGLTFLEALAANKICIAPEIGGCRDFVDGKNNFLIKKSGEKKIAENIIFEGITYNKYDVDNISSTMRYVFENCSNLKDNSNKNRKLLSGFDKYSVSSSFIKYYKEIEG